MEQSRYVRSRIDIVKEFFSYFKDKYFWIGFFLIIMGSIIILVSVSQDNLFYTGIFIGIFISIIGLIVSGLRRYAAAKRTEAVWDKYYPQSQRTKTIMRIITYVIIALMIIGSFIYVLYSK